MRSEKHFNRLRNILKEHGTKPLDEISAQLRMSDYRTKQLLLQFLNNEIGCLRPNASSDNAKYLYKIFKYFEFVSDETEEQWVVTNLERAAYLCKKRIKETKNDKSFSNSDRNIFKKLLDIIDVSLLNIEYQEIEENARHEIMPNYSKEDSKTSYNLLNYLIYDVRNYNYLFELLKMFPENLIVKNANGIYLIEELICKYIDAVKDDHSNIDIIYYEKIVKLFLNDPKLAIEMGVGIEDKLIKKLEEVLEKIDNGLHVPKDKDKSNFFLKEVICDISKKESDNRCMKQINYKYDVKEYFERPVIEEAKKLTTTHYGEQILDCRNKYTVTVDNENTWAYDDACSLEQLPNGNYLLGIYVADVTLAVPRNSLVDLEARKRAETLYLGSYNITMLPVSLTHKLTLKQNEDRNAIGYFFELDKDANCLDFSVKRCLINVDTNYSYDTVNCLLTDSRNIEEIKTLKQMYYISNKFHENSDIRMQYRTLKKMKKTIENNTISTNIPTDIAATMIADFMVQTNAFVANYFHKHPEIPFIYRINLSSYGNDIVEKIKDISKSNVSFEELTAYIKYICPPSIYSSLNLGHNGLVLPAYCHATNPLRNYPSLEVERIIVDHMINDGSNIDLNQSKIYLDKLCNSMNSRMSLNLDYIDETKQYIKKHINIDKN